MPQFRFPLPVRRRTPNRNRRLADGATLHRRGFELLEPRLVLTGNPMITEFMASNSGTLNDGDGLSSDWVEIHNPTNMPINLAGWHLTDSATNLDKWTFPAVPQSLLEPGEYLVVFASNKNIETYIDPAGYLHADFSLNAEGEYLALTDPNETIIHEYSPQYPRQVEDVSFGLLSSATTVTLVGPAQATSALVPTNGALDAPAVGVAPAWTLPTFNDSSWATSSSGVGVGFDFGDDAVTNVPNGTLLPDGLIGFDLTDADENGTPEGTITAGGFPGSPANEEPPKALDNSESTTWLAFLPAGTFYQFRFSASQRHAVNGYTITSANDAQNRDPYSWTLSGSNDGTNYTVIDTRSAQTFASRFQTRLYEFNNATAYEYYRFDFKTKFGVTGLEADRPNANAIQMAEIELFARQPVDFTPAIALNVEAAWQPAKTSVYQRVEFNVADPADLVSLLLELQYDDGFVAYLNGKRVAAVNAPALPNFQTNASAKRDNALALVPQSFDLSAHLGELVAGTNVLAVHVLNIDDASQDLFSKPRLTARALVDDTLIPVYMTEPSPGAINNNGFTGLVDTPQLSAPHGFYDAPFQLAITNNTPSTQVYFTLDGSQPAPDNGTLYTGPILVSGTTTVRAQAFRTGYLASAPVTSTYLFVNDIIRQNFQATLNKGFPSAWGGTTPDYGMDPDVIGNFDPTGNSLGGDRFGGIYAATIKNDLRAIPTLSLVMDIDDMFGPNGIYTNSTFNGDAWERATSVELIYPDGTPGFQIDAGVQMHGGAFRSHSLSRKHSMRLVFKGIYGGNTKLDFPWFGEDAATSFDTIVLRMDSNDGYAWSTTGPKAQYARDEWGRRTQEDLGQPHSHGGRVHLYINGVYWGLYNPVERPDGAFAASYYGGEKEEWDAINTGEVLDGTIAAWNTLNTLSQAVASAGTEAARTAAYMRVLGLNPDGTDNASYETYLDAVNYVDYLLVNFYGGNNDWPQRNWYSARRRGPQSQGFVFHSWDFEWTLGLQSDINTNRLGVTDGAGTPYSRLKSSQEFRVLFGDRAHRALFNGGALTSANNVVRYQQIVGELPQAIVAESARWGDMHASTPYTKANWQNEINNVVSFLTNRNTIFLQQLRSAGLYPSITAPSFNQHGGQVPSGFNLTMAAPAGTIWYTLDGSDPRAIGGAVSPAAIQYTGGPVAITGGVMVRARVLSGGQWSAVNEADFVSDVSQLRITELHYNPAAQPGVADRQDLEYFEITNTGNQTVSLSGVVIAGFGDPYAFAQDAVVNAGQRMIVARKPAVFQSVYGPGFNLAAAGYSPSNLSNSGELVTLLGPSGETIQSFTYGSTAPWPSSPDGGGPSLEIINPLGDSNSPTNWRASAYVGGSPGASGIVGDYNGDGAVNDADRAQWRASFGQAVARGTSADGNRDSIIDAADFVVWRNQQAATLPATSGSAIGELAEAASILADTTSATAEAQPAALLTAAAIDTALRHEEQDAIGLPARSQPTTTGASEAIRRRQAAALWLAAPYRPDRRMTVDETSFDASPADVDEALAEATLASLPPISSWQKSSATA